MPASAPPHVRPTIVVPHHPPAPPAALVPSTEALPPAQAVSERKPQPSPASMQPVASESLPPTQPPGSTRPAPQRVAPPMPGEPERAQGESIERGATGPQLRRFIKSRAYVPMHELRRRFLINGGDDEVTPVDLADRRRIFVGLPEREGHLLGELLRGGDIGYELSMDPISPIVVGVYPMRPVTRA